MAKRIQPGLLLFLALAIVLLPVAVRQLLPAEARRYDAVTLDQSRYIEVYFRNELQEIDLAGMLFIPAGEGPFPAAVIIHGSGTSDRANRWYLTLSGYLQDNGIAVLLPDKRGSGKAGGDWRTADFEALATDTVAAVEFMRHQEHVPVSGTGIIGMSQGGWIAPIVARESGDVTFIVNMVGSAVTPKEQLLYEEDHNLRQLGFLPGISYLIALASTAHIRHVRAPQFYDRVGDYDPIPLWDSTEIPVLVLYGSDDTNVPSRESAARLESLGKDSITVIVYDGSGHALQDPPGEGNSLIRRAALDEIAGFINGAPAGAGAGNSEMN